MALSLTKGDTRLIIDTAKKRGLLRNQCAYVLATAWHETAHTMKPVREYGGEKYLRSKQYYPYVGMGYVQLTWLANYQRATRELGVDFVKSPKRLLEPKHAAEILVVGSAEGWFTTRKLSDYITESKSDFKGARRIINGTDKSAMIAGYAKEYDALLKADGYAATPVKDPKESILKLGSEGPFVQELQTNLNALGYGPLEVDGKFGKSTKDAVETFQRLHKLEVDGWAGPRTIEAIGKTLAEKAAKPKIEDAEKKVPPSAPEQVKKKTGLWGWIVSVFTLGSGGFSKLLGAEWPTVLAVFGGGALLLIIILLMRRQIIAAFKEINAELQQ